MLPVFVHHVRGLHVVSLLLRVAHIVVAAEASVIAHVRARVRPTVCLAQIACQLLINAATTLVARLPRNTQIVLSHRLRVLAHVRVRVHAVLALGLLVGKRARGLADLRPV